MDVNVKELVIQALENTNLENKQIVLGSLPEVVIKKLIQDSDIDLTGYVCIIDVYAVRHILKSHGNAQKEEKRGQRAVEANHFELIYQVIQEPDVVFYDGKNRIGRDVLQFQK